MNRTSLIFLLSVISLTSTAIVKWVPNTSFNMQINFKDGKLPCSKQTVVFPETIIGTVRLESGTSVGGFILPDTGEIILSEGTISLGEDPKDTNCTDASNVYFVDRSTSSWNHPDVWSSPRFNEATPDSERVPCFDDTVEFPDESFSILLPDETQIVSAIKIANGTSILNTNSFDSIVYSQDVSQQFIMNDYEDTGVVVKQQQCQSIAGCPCQKEVLKIDCSMKFCSVPSCVDPIKPLGHCCKVCGGVIAFEIDETFDIKQFEELVDRIIDSYGKEKLVYHIGRIPPNKVQLVVIENGGYEGTSAEAVNTISYSMEGLWFQGEKLSLFSGSPLSKQGLGWKIFVSMFFGVVFVMGGVYVYYYKVPDVRFPLMGRRLPSMLSRLQRRTESVVSLTRRDSTVTIGTSGGSAFRNPLYDSKRDRVEVVESTADE